MMHSTAFGFASNDSQSIAGTVFGHEWMDLASLGLGFAGFVICGAVVMDELYNMSS